MVIVHYVIWFGLGLVEGIILNQWYEAKRQLSKGLKLIKRSKG